MRTWWHSDMLRENDFSMALVYGGVLKSFLFK